MRAQNNTTPQQELDAQQQNIVTISALTAKGDLSHLKEALNAGLNVGLSVNEIKDVLVQLYAYCGFPRSLNAVTTFMAVIDERKAKGIVDADGKEASPVTDTEKYQTGKKTLEVLTGKVEQGPKTGMAAFVPSADTFLKEHLFADIFSRDVLTYAQRELATIAALLGMTGVDPQLQAHMGMGMNVGITEAQLRQAIMLVKDSSGPEFAETGTQTLDKILAAKTQTK